MSTWLRLHWHAFADAWRRVGSQPLAAAFSVLVLAVAIALPVMAAIALQSVGAVTSGLETDPHVNVYLALDASDEDARRVGDALSAYPLAAAVKFVPRSQALEELKASTHLAELLASHRKIPGCNKTLKLAKSATRCHGVAIGGTDTPLHGPIC